MPNITIRSNSAQINPNFGQRVAPAVNTAALEAQARAIGAMGNTVGAIKAEIDKHNEQQEALRIMNATNAVNLQLGELKSDMEKNMQGSNGVNAQAYYNSAAAEIVRNAYANSGIRYKAGENAFRRAVDSHVVQGSVWARNFQNAQQDRVAMTSYDQLVDNSITDVMQGGSLKDNLDKVDFFARSALNYKPKEQLDVLKKETADKFAGALVQDAIARNDYMRGSMILSEIGPNLSSGMQMRLGDALYRNQEYTENRSIARQIADQTYGRNMTDDQKRDLIRKSGGALPEGYVNFKSGVSFKGAQEQTVTGTKALAGIFQSMGMDFLVTSVASDYGGHAQGERSHYAGVKADIASDALENMTPRERADFIARLESQLPGIRILNEYDNPSNGSTGGHLDVDFTDYKGDSGMSEMRVDQILNQVNAQEAYQARQQRLAEDAFVRDSVNTVFGMQQAGTSMEDAISWAKEQANGNYETYNKLMGTINHIYGNGSRSATRSGTGTYKLSPNQEAYLENRIENGMMSQAELEDYLANAGGEGVGVSGSDAQKWLNRNDKARKGEGEYSYDWSGLINSIKDRMGKGKVTNEDAMALKQFAQRYVRNYIEENNKLPDNDKVLDEMQKALTKGEYGGIKVPGTIFSDKYSEIDLNNHGIWQAVMRQDGQIEVYYYGETDPVLMTRDAFNAKMEGKV